MSCPFHHERPAASRRSILAALATTLGASASAAQAQTKPAPPVSVPTGLPRAEPFFGAHQSGIATPQQLHLSFASLDLVTAKRSDVIALLRIWTQAAARLAEGLSAVPISQDLEDAAADGGAALGLAPARLTLTFGFGPGLFSKDGKDRYGLAALKPEALSDLPKFHGDQLELPRSGGDISVQACADDPQVAFHAIRELVRLAYGHAELRWTQSGFLPSAPAGETPRNLMGFKDGTNNPQPGQPPVSVDVPRNLDQVVWVAKEGLPWMHGGSYQVARRIRISLEHWDRTPVSFQEEVIGRRKYSGAPIGKHSEMEPLGLGRADQDGNPIISDTAHVRLGAASVNEGAQILRRAYSYNDGLSFTAERWPPWRQGMMYDAGLFFIAYQRDPRSGFSKIYENMAKMDALNQYTTHNASALFACPPGVQPGEYIAQHLFEAAA